MRDKLPLTIPPGVVRGASDAMTTGRWYNSNLIRWVEGVLTPIGGWERQVLNPTASKIRAMHTWADATGKLRTALLCEAHVYVIQDDELIDISPAAPMVAPFANLLAGGYGDGAYGAGAFGTPRPNREKTKTVGPAWSIGNFGDILLVMSSYDGRLLQWTPGTAKCVAASGAPTSNRLFVITAQKSVMLFGMGGDPSAFGWCSHFDLADWNFAGTTNTAGRYNVEPSAVIVAAIATRFGVLFFSTVGPYLVSYAGLPLVYTYDSKGKGAVPLSNQVLAECGGQVVWPTDDGIWSFDGANLVPVECPLFDWFKNTRDTTYSRYRMSAVNLGSYTEVWWFFPAKGKGENDTYLQYDFVHGWWAKGMINRSCGVAAIYTTYPVMSDGANVYLHERGNYYYEATALPFAESAALSIKSGSSFMTIIQAIVDIGASAASASYRWFYREPRNNRTGEKTKGPLVARDDGYLDVMVTGRDIRLRIESTAQGVEPWTFGQWLLKIAERGQR